MKRLIATAPIVIFVALVLVFGLKSLHRNPEVQTHALVGKPVPRLAMAPLGGGTPLDTAEASGTTGPYIVNFFASWCGPCIEEEPALLALRAQGVRIVGVNYKDAVTAGQAFLDKYGDPYVAHLTDPDGRIGIEFGVTAVPESFLVGSNGVVLAKVSAPMSEPEAQALWAKAK